MNPRVKEVHPRENFTLFLVFRNGETGVYDCAPILGFGVFAELSDRDYFMRARVTGATVAWPHGQDICPDTLYQDSRKPAPDDLDFSAAKTAAPKNEAARP